MSEQFSSHTRSTRPEARDASPCVAPKSNLQPIGSSVNPRSPDWIHPTVPEESQVATFGNLLSASESFLSFAITTDRTTTISPSYDHQGSATAALVPASPTNNKEYQRHT
ncbi:hypothetical protein V6N12_042609 [Hibiscus sabdariffa]|uniref:Uncharacterized protein n=1 Tax=Hibiscus sabdariffa TaxID=183260 RepID=A0ABR2EJ05_9ROSI